MTYEEAKHKIAIKYGCGSWSDIDFYAIDCRNQILNGPFSQEILLKDVAELYAESAFCKGARQQKILCAESVKAGFIVDQAPSPIFNRIPQNS